MPKIHGATPPLFKKVYDRYGYDSKIAEFVRNYKVENGKALLAVTLEAWFGSNTWSLRAIPTDLVVS